MNWKHLGRIAIEPRLDPHHPLANRVGNPVKSLQWQAREPANDRADQAKRIPCSPVRVQEG